MQPQLAFLHRDTPSMTVVEPRGLAVRSVDYYRAAQGEVAEARVNRTVHDPAGRAIAQWDPRLFLETSAPANLSSILSLSDTVLSTVSVDAGLSVSLIGEADQPVQSWDGRGSQRWMHYDNQLRLTALFEQALEGVAVCAERLTYAANDPESANRNQCGQLIRRDDRAGTQLFPTFGLTGGLLEQTRHFLRTLEIPDWPVPVDERDTWLEPGSGATTRSRFNPLGEAVEQSDAQGNRQLFSHTVAGQLREVRLQLRSDTTPKTLVSAIQYNAHGQTEREVAGNGVITTLEYAAQDARLIRLHARRGNDVLQDSHYEYDPTGNVLRIEDAAVPIRYFANQRIDPVNGYAYDSLNQLIRATGWEAGGANRGPQFSAFDDPAPRGNYCQSYRYDRGGNLLELIHEGPQKHGHRLVAAPFSNRCLPVVEGVEPGEEDFRRGFDANGNLQRLQLGQTLSWDLHNQLCEVRPVERDGAPNDSEHYVYGADGMRVRKVRSTQTNARTVLVEVRYLPNLEVRTHSGTGEVLHVINVQAGRSSVRVLHWETAPPKDSANDQYRFCLSDHLGSCTLELDSDGEVISLERYHPFGTTAWFAGRGEVEASRKTVRYSGKERDATGLYYYGFRYYVAWLQRWLNPDPIGTVDGLNFFRMLRNSPINNRDEEGGVSYDVMGEEEAKMLERNGAQMLHHGLENFPEKPSKVVRGSMLLVKSWLSETIKALEQDEVDRFTSMIMELSFGTDYKLPENDPKGLQRKILGTFKQLKSFVDELSGDSGWRLSLVETSKSVFYGVTFPTTNQGNIMWLNRQFIENAHEAGIAKTIAHEGLHAMGEFFGEDFIGDFWYVGLDSPLASASADEVGDYSFGVEYSSTRGTNKKGILLAPSEDEMVSAHRQHYISLINRNVIGSGKPSSVSSKEREDIYRTTSAVRRSVGLQNADTMAVMLLPRYRPSQGNS
jgi:insecticidal toxin complex protein TccC